MNCPLFIIYNTEIFNTGKFNEPAIFLYNLYPFFIKNKQIIENNSIYNSYGGGILLSSVKYARIYHNVFFNLRDSAISFNNGNEINNEILKNLAVGITNKIKEVFCFVIKNPNNLFALNLASCSNCTGLLLSFNDFIKGHIANICPSHESVFRIHNFEANNLFRGILWEGNYSPRHKPCQPLSETNKILYNKKLNSILISYCYLGIFINNIKSVNLYNFDLVGNIKYGIKFKNDNKIYLNYGKIINRIGKGSIGVISPTNCTLFSISNTKFLNFQKNYSIYLLNNKLKFNITIMKLEFINCKFEKRLFFKENGKSSNTFQDVSDKKNINKIQSRKYYLEFNLGCKNSSIFYNITSCQEKITFRII